LTFLHEEVRKLFFWADLAERHGLSVYKTGTFKELEIDNVRVVGLTSRQQEADLRKATREQVQQEWEKEGERKMKLLMISDLEKQVKREPKKEVELSLSSEGIVESEIEEQVEQVEIPPKGN